MKKKIILNADATSILDLASLKSHPLSPKAQTIVDDLDGL